MTGWLIFIGYIVAPFILFSINDYLAGLWFDRFYSNMALYNSDAPIIVLCHVFWPIVVIFWIIAWLIEFKKYKFGKFNWSTMYNAGRAKRKQEHIEAHRLLKKVTNEQN